MAFPCQAETSYEKGHDAAHLCTSPVCSPELTRTAEVDTGGLHTPLAFLCHVALATCCPSLGLSILSLFILRGMDGVLK